MLARPELDDTSHKMLAAADLLKKDGWCTHIRKNSLGERCLLGALDDITGTYQNTNRCHEAANRLAAMLPLIESHSDVGKSEYWQGKLPTVWKIANWNNYVCKSAEEAANKLREAAYAPVKDQVY